MIIGFTGTNASGKTTIVNYLIAKGFNYNSLSDVIRAELDERGMEHSRNNMRLVGNELREKYGPSVLADRIIANLKSEKSVIDSIRNTFEVYSLRQLPEFILIAVDAPIEQRYRRALKRGRIESATDLESFIVAENKEMSNTKTAQNIHMCMEQADHLLYNDGRIEDIYRQVDDILMEWV